MEKEFFIYRLIKDNEIIYVGKTTHVLSRIYQHRQDKEFDLVEILQLKSDAEMSIGEIYFITKYKPELNIEFKDDSIVDMGVFINIDYFESQIWMNVEEYKECKEKMTRKKPVVKLTLDGEFIDEFDSLASACISVNKPYNNYIGNACKGMMASAYGFKWMYKEDYESKTDLYFEVLGKENRCRKNFTDKSVSVFALNIDDNSIVQEFESIMEALRWLNKEESSNAGNISKVCKGKTKSAYGFKWIYKEDYENKTDLYYLILENATGHDARSISLKGNQGVKDALSVPVVKLQKGTEVVLGVYNSLTDALHSLGKTTGQGAMGEVCRGKRKSLHGFGWMYKEDYESKYGEIKMHTEKIN